MISSFKRAFYSNMFLKVDWISLYICHEELYSSPRKMTVIAS